MNNSWKIDRPMIAFILVAVIISTASSCLGQPLIHGNTEAISIIVNVFSILAGFLIAIMTLTGSQGLELEETWRSHAIKKTIIHRRLMRYQVLFTLYLLVLGGIFLGTLIAKKYPESTIVIYIEHIYLFIVALSFIISLTLPQHVINLQMEKYDLIIENKKNNRKNY